MHLSEKQGVGSSILPLATMKNKLFTFLLALKYFINNYKYLSHLSLLTRKVNQNIELEDEEYYEVKNFLAKLPDNLMSYVDIGAGNGVNGSSVLKLAENELWRGLHIEYGDVSVLSNIYREFKNIQIAKIGVNPTNIVNLFDGYEIGKEFGYLNLDIDSFDYEVLESILVEGYRPAVASIEINQVIPPPIFYYAKYSDHSEEYMVDYFFGCSLTAVNHLMNKFDYNLSHIYGNNAFFLHRDHFDQPKMQEIDAYNKGYVQMKNRKLIYSYNQRVDFLINEDPNKVCNFLDNLWKDKKTDYELRISD